MGEGGGGGSGTCHLDDLAENAYNSLEKPLNTAWAVQHPQQQVHDHGQVAALHQPADASSALTPWEGAAARHRNRCKDLVAITTHAAEASKQAQ